MEAPLREKTGIIAGTTAAFEMNDKDQAELIGLGR